MNQWTRFFFVLSRRLLSIIGPEIKFCSQSAMTSEAENFLDLEFQPATTTTERNAEMLGFFFVAPPTYVFTKKSCCLPFWKPFGSSLSFFNANTLMLVLFDAI